MTTIAYKNGVVAYDSQITAGPVICTLSKNKKRTVQGVVFILSGGINGMEEVIKGYLEQSYQLGDTAEGIAIDNGEMNWVGMNDDYFWNHPLNLPSYAWGSGGHFAMGAMDMGATAKEAVKIACGRDVYSGGRIRIYELPNTETTNNL